MGESGDYLYLNILIVGYVDTRMCLFTSTLEMRSLSDEEWNASLAKDYDVFIVGSDQVWRPCYALPIERYFLSFLDATGSNPRIAYAASFGTENCEFSANQNT